MFLNTRNILHIKAAAFDNTTGRSAKEGDQDDLLQKFVSRELLLILSFSVILDINISSF